MRGRWLAAFCALAASAADAETRFTIADSVEAGGDRFLSNTLSLTVEPSERWAIDLAVGASRSGTRVTDTSGGLGISAHLGDAVTAAARFDRYRGGRGFLFGRLYDPALSRTVIGIAGETERRQGTGTFLGSLRVRVLGAGEEEEAEREDRVLRAVDLKGELGFGTLRIPLEGPGRLQPGDVTQRQWEAMAGVAATITASELEVSYRRRHYGDLALPPLPEVIPPAVRRALAEQIRSEVAYFLSEPTLYTGTGSFYEPLPGDLSLYASYAYSRLLVSRAIARTLVVELGWRPTDRWGFRLGGLAVRDGGKTTKYGTAGVSFSF